MWGEVRGCLMCRDAPGGHPVPVIEEVLVRTMATSVSCWRLFSQWLFLSPLKFSLQWCDNLSCQAVNDVFGIRRS